jgi:hypothetical protein
LFIFASNKKTMRRFFAFILLTLVLSSCDDGDLTEVTFEFDDSSAEACNTNTNDFFIFKAQDRRALIVQLPETSFKNQITADRSTPLEPLTIDAATIRLIYREYSGDVTSGTICSAVPASDPVVVKEQEATQGKIRITTTAIKTAPDANGTTRITDYLHTLTFSDLKFDLGNGTSQINEAFRQVTFLTPATPFSNFSGLPNLLSCSNDASKLFKFNPTQSLVLDLSVEDAAFLFSNEVGTKKRLISSGSTLTHSVFNTATASLSNAYFCATSLPGTPEVLHAFAAENGITDTSGIIEVTSLASDNGFKHTIVLRKMRLVKGTLKVQMADEFIFGEIETSN